MLLNATFETDGTLNLQMVPCKRSNGTLKVIENPEKLFNHLTDSSFGAAVTHSGILISE